MEEFRDTYVEKCRDFLCEPVPSLLKAVDAAIEKRQQLTLIKLNGNSKALFNKRLEYMQVFALTEALHDSTVFTTLDLSFNHIDNAGLATITRLLKFNKSLRHINLEGNDITEDGAVQLAGVLSAPGGGGGGVMTLNLRGNPIGEVGGRAMAEMLAVNTTLRNLDLGSTQIGTKTVVAVATVLSQANKTLQRLSLENPRLFSLQEETTRHIASMLAVNTSLQELKLGKHGMRDAGLETLVAYGLTKNSNLAILDLRCNEISEEGGGSLRRLLMENSTLRSLKIASNRLCNNGAAAVAEGLSYTLSLTVLDIACNSIGDQGLLRLATALMSNSTVVSLKVWGNAFDQTSSRAFYELFQRNGYKTDIRPYAVDDNVYIAKINAAA